MDENTINKLRNNPHYKLDSHQKSELRKSMIETGKLDIHPTGMVKRRRSRKKKNEK